MLKNLKYQEHAHGYGFVGNLLTTGELFGAGYLFGRYTVSKPKTFGMDTPLAIGLTFKAASLALCLFDKGTSLCPHLDAVGNAGVAVYGASLGAQHGAVKHGMNVAVLPKGAATRVQGLAPGTMVLGAIAPAPSGRLLSADDLARLAR
jgi:hypothetical protein